MKIVCVYLCLLHMQVFAQGDRWMRLYDDIGTTNGVSSIVLAEDTTYRVVSVSFTAGYGRLVAMGIDATGDTLWSKALRDTSSIFQGGGTHSVRMTSGGDILFAGTRYPGAGGEPDGMVVRFSNAGDSLSISAYGGSQYEVFNGLCLALNGDAVCSGVYDPSQADVLAVRSDGSGSVVWQHTYGSSLYNEVAYCIDACQDGGFLIGGYKKFSNSDYDMYVIKIDSNGSQQWARNYGSPWVDNAAFPVELSDGRIIMAGSEHASSSSPERPVLYLLAPDGTEIWSVLEDDEPVRSVFYSLPIVLEDGGYAISGGKNYGSQVRGMLTRTDSLGNMLWRRTYKTNDVIDHYIYDLRRTLDGGFIMAGTAFDSLLVSQDAWLVKVDSFGCLVPGCQVFDGLQEQVTSLTGAMTLSPNPANDRVEVSMAIPSSFKLSGPLLLTVVSSDGRIVLQDQLRSSTTIRTLDVSTLVPGLYHLHLTDGHTWLAGSKLVKE